MWCGPHPRSGGRSGRGCHGTRRTAAWGGWGCVCGGVSAWAGRWVNGWVWDVSAWAGGWVNGWVWDNPRSVRACAGAPTQRAQRAPLARLVCKPPQCPHVGEARPRAAVHQGSVLAAAGWCVWGGVCGGVWGWVRGGGVSSKLRAPYRRAGGAGQATPSLPHTHTHSRPPALPTIISPLLSPPPFPLSRPPFFPPT